MSIDQRWTDQTEQLIATAICINAGHNCLVIEAHRMQARETLAALADAGLLVEPGSEDRSQWRVTAVIHDPNDYNNGKRLTIGQDITRRRHIAEDTLRSIASRDRIREPRLEQRTVHVGPWRETS